MAPLRVALAGYGLAGEVFHAPLIAATPGLELVTVATRDPERAARARAAVPGVQVVDDIRDHLAGHDLLVVAAVNSAHAQLTHAGLDAGLHVVVDKPVTITATAAREVAAHARRAGRLVMPFHNRRWDADFLTLRHLLERGELGALVRWESRFCRWRPEPRPGSWRETSTPDEGGGLLLDLGTHLVDQVVALLGPPATVYAELGTRRHGVGAEDDVFLALTSRDGVHAHLWASAVAADSGPRIRALGTGGGYVREALDGQEDALRAGRHPVAGEPWDPEGGHLDGWLVRGDARARVGVPGAWPAFYAGVELAVRAGGPPPVAYADAITVLEVLEAARRSADQSEIVRL